ncbi:MAG: hypothetical protein NkDv07_0513 [Candidatus Improbicoccus devescovinae]|nr:MAG: hypothetical protein NkDv07_0513 [Candidatus Improbicoccus devescovinae]
MNKKLAIILAFCLFFNIPSTRAVQPGEYSGTMVLICANGDRPRVQAHVGLLSEREFNVSTYGKGDFGKKFVQENPSTPEAIINWPNGAKLHIRFEIFEEQELGPRAQAVVQNAFMAAIFYDTDDPRLKGITPRAKCVITDVIYWFAGFRWSNVLDFWNFDKEALDFESKDPEESARVQAFFELKNTTVQLEHTHGYPSKYYPPTHDNSWQRTYSGNPGRIMGVISKGYSVAVDILNFPQTQYIGPEQSHVKKNLPADGSCGVA